MNIEIVNIQDLRLDPENPRLPLSVDRIEEVMLRYIAENYSIEELMVSIGENGFFPGEPIIVLRHPDKHIVIEGNRRLTAVKLLNEPALVNLPSITRIANEAIQPPPIELPVVFFDRRSDVMNYLGHRHITGVKPWSSFAKARYLDALYRNKLVETDDKREAVMTATRMIGSRRDYVERILGTLNVCNIIDENNYFDFDDVGEHNLPFSVFYTAFQRASIRQYVGYTDLYAVEETPINIDNLKNLTKWFCVKVNGSTTLKNPGNLEKLAVVLEYDAARSELESGATIDQALAYTDSPGQDFLNELHIVKRALASLNSRVAEVEFDDSLDIQIKAIIEQIKSLRSSWISKTTEDDL